MPRSAVTKRTPRLSLGQSSPAYRRVWAPGLLAALVAGLSLATGAAPPAETGQPPPGPHPSCRWTFLGPRAIPRGEGFDGTRVPVTGRVTSLAIDAGDSRRVYLGSALAGVWRSLDGGETWRPASAGIGSPAIGALAADPLVPGRVYAGTGEANLAFRREVVVGDRPLLGDRGKGFLRSEDGGATWEVSGQVPFAGAAFAELAASPHQADLVLAATTAGLFRSRDAGRSWARLDEGLPLEAPQRMATSVVLHPRDPQVAYAAFWGAGVFRTGDLASERPHWQRLQGGLPLSNLSRIGVVASAAAPDELYVYAADADSELRGLYRSTDRGDSWSPLAGAPDLFEGQGFYNLLVAAHPASPQVLFLGGAGDRRLHTSSLYRVARIGTDWRYAPVGGSLHVDFHALVFDPRQPDTIYAANDGGVWRSDNGGGDWRPLNAGLPIVQFNKIDQHPTSGAFVIGGTQDNGTVFFLGDGVWDHGDDGDGGSVAIDPNHPDVVYDEFSLYKVARSEKGGRYGSFTPIFPERKGIRSVFYAPFALCRERPETIALGLDRVFLSEDSGKSWTMASIDLSRGWTNRLESNAISAVLFPSASRLFVGTSDGKVWRLDRGEGQWQTRLLHTPPGAERGAYVTDLALDPTDPRGLLVTFFGGPEPAVVELVENASGEIAERALGDLAGKVDGGLAIEPDRLRPGVLYASTEAGVFRSLDGGRSLQPFAAGLPPSPVTDLQVHPSLPLLRAATHGWGVWEIDLSGEACPVVEAYVRDSELDQGRTWASVPAPAGAAPDASAPDSPDLVVVREGSVAPATVDGIRFFSELEPAAPVAGEASRVFVHVASRGPQSAEHASVHLYTASGSTPPAVRLGRNAPGPGWKRLGESTLPGLGPDSPRVASFPWQPEGAPGARLHLLLVVQEGEKSWGLSLGREGEELPVTELARRDRRVALETVTIGLPAALTGTP